MTHSDSGAVSTEIPTTTTKTTTIGIPSSVRNINNIHRKKNEKAQGICVYTHYKMANMSCAICCITTTKMTTATTKRFISLKYFLISSISFLLFIFSINFTLLWLYVCVCVCAVEGAMSVFSHLLTDNNKSTARKAKADFCTISLQ